MKTVSTIAATRAHLSSVRGQGRSVALVPTMGNLHDGHVSLVRHARTLADCVVATIFVNPMQFGPSEDLAKYPRTFAEDQDKLSAEGVELLFAPADEEVYPSGKDHHTQVQVPELSSILCGAARPGHFVGVTTVVTMLFNIVQPDCAVFGQKDFQQLAIIRRMVNDLALPIRIVGCPTVREADGLAMSSRNQYLSPAERSIAPRLNRTLRDAAARLERGDRDHAAIMRDALAALRSSGFVPDYFEIRGSATLLPPGADERELVLLVAARLGNTRLIDNHQVTLPGKG